VFYHDGFPPAFAYAFLYRLRAFFDCIFTSARPTTQGVRQYLVITRAACGTNGTPACSLLLLVIPGHVVGNLHWKVEDSTHIFVLIGTMDLAFFFLLLSGLLLSCFLLLALRIGRDRFVNTFSNYGKGTGNWGIGAGIFGTGFATHTLVFSISLLIHISHFVVLDNPYEGSLTHFHTALGFSVTAKVMSYES
jgi:hypothetical protein